jgi:exodeoxyribonuclease VII large subunit
MNTEIVSVSQLNQQVRMMLETRYASFLVQGELSNVSTPASGHVYFTLKDSKAQVKSAMFRSQVSRNAYQLKSGDEVIVRAKASLYDARGDYQLIVQSVKPAGVGQLQLAFEQLRDQLFAEGLFEPEIKKAIIPAQHCLGIVTSSTGAALQDILNVLKRRAPNLHILVFPALVQGKDGAKQICAAIERANQDKRCELLIVGRGGGSIEDLWNFNEESVARAIFASSIPIISAVGHETDVTISDFVADLRAPTPSAAAELASFDQSDLILQFKQLSQRLMRSYQHTLLQCKQQLNVQASRLIDPKRQLQQYQQRCDELEQRLQSAIQRILKTNHENKTRFAHRLELQNPINKIELKKDHLAQQQQALLRALMHRLDHCKQQFSQQAAMLDAYSPLKTLTRGYAIAFDENHKVVHSIKQVSSGDTLNIRVNDGEIQSKVS